MLEDIIKQIDEIVDCIDFSLSKSVYENFIDYVRDVSRKNKPKEHYDFDYIVSQVLGSGISFDRKLFVPYLVADNLSKNQIEPILDDYIVNYMQTDSFKEKMKKPIFLASDTIKDCSKYKLKTDTFNAALQLNPYKLFTEAIINATGSSIDNDNIWGEVHNFILKKLNKIYNYDSREMLGERIVSLVIHNTSNDNITNILNKFLQIAEAYKRKS